jgi:molybdopterin biosynthesis enzyme
VPAQATALREGWAVAAADVVGASSYSPVVIAVQPPWVETGEAMPAGTDAVLPPDAVLARNGLAEVVAEAAPGEAVRRAGQDAASGAILREAGQRVRSSDIALALAAGIEQAFVREARVRILALPGSALDDGGELAARYCEAAGAGVERAGLPARDADAIARELAGAGSELILLIGGTGQGRHHHAAEALAASGSLIAHGIALRPGDTCGCGVVGATAVILMPRTLGAALAATLALVLPCLDHLMCAAPRPTSVVGPLTRKVSSAIGMTDIVLLRRSGNGLEPLAAGDLPLAAIGSADGWLAIPPDCEGFAAGETVAAFLL